MVGNEVEGCLRDGLARPKQAAGIAECTELEGIAELVMAATAALDHRKGSIRQRPMADEIGFDNWKGKQVLKLRFSERAASRHSRRPKWSVGCLLRFVPQQEQGVAGPPAG